MNILFLVKVQHRHHAPIEALLAALSSQHTVNLLIAETIEQTQHDLRSLFRPEHTLVVAGGDGTLHHAIQAFDEWFRAKQKPHIALFPFGSGNDFARAFQIPSTLEHWLAVFEAQHHAAVDIGFIAAPHNRYYLCCASLGISAHAARISHSLRWLHPRFRYLVATAFAIPYCKPFALSVQLDNSQPIVYPQTAHSLLANTSFFGGGIVSTPNADPGDGRQNFVRLSDGLHKLLLHIFSILKGRFLHLRNASTTVAETISFKTDRPILIQADGEIIGTTPARITTLPGALELVVPEGS